MKYRKHHNHIPSNAEIQAIGKTLHDRLADPVEHFRKRIRMIENQLQRPINFCQEGFALTGALTFIPLAGRQKLFPGLPAKNQAAYHGRQRFTASALISSQVETASGDA